jgi:hypothetical protein
VEWRIISTTQGKIVTIKKVRLSEVSQWQPLLSWTTFAVCMAIPSTQGRYPIVTPRQWQHL